MNDEDLKNILWHKDRTIERQKAIIEDQKQLISIMENKLNLLQLENTILQSALFLEKGEHPKQLTLKL